MNINDKSHLYEVEFSSLFDSNADYLDDDIAIFENLTVLPKLNATRLKFNAFCSCIQGHMSLEVNGIPYTVNPGETFICPSGVIVTQLMISPDFVFKLLILTDRIVQALLSSNVDLWNKAVYVRQEHVVRPLSDKQKGLSIHFLAIIRSLMEEKEMPFREEMMRSVLNIILLSFCAAKREKNVEEEASLRNTYSHGRTLFNKFIDLIKTEPIKHRPVYYYAEKLCISSKYLSHICKETTGKPANEFIQAAVVEEISYYLRSSTLSIKEISIKMGFPNISFFGKYVKDRFGLSPNEYRRRLYAEKI